MNKTGTVIVIGAILVLADLGVRTMIRVFQGKDRCECPGDCSKCTIQCQSNEKYYGIQHPNVPQKNVK